MPQEVLCPICGAAYNLADEQIGKKVRCKKCEHAFTAGDKPRRRDDDDDDDDDDRPRGRSKSRRRRDEEEDRPKKTKSIEEQAKPKGQREPGLPVSSFVIMGVVVAVLVLCCGGGGTFWWIASSSHPRPNPQPPPNRGGRRGEVPALRRPVAWLNDVAGARGRAGWATQFADRMTPV